MLIISLAEVYMDIFYNLNFHFKFRGERWQVCLLGILRDAEIGGMTDPITQVWGIVPNS